MRITLISRIIEILKTKSNLLFVLAIGLTLTACTKPLGPDKLSKAIQGLAASSSLVPIDHFVFSNISSPQTAGVAFSVSIGAYDASNNIITDLTGLINFTDLTQTLSPSSVLFVNGIATANFVITQATSLTAIVSVPGINVPLNQSNPFQVVPGPFFKYACSNSPTTTQIAGTPFTLEFIAQDAYGNLVNTHNTINNISLLSTLGGLTLPVGGQTFSAGYLTLTNGVTLTRTGNQQVSIFDPTSNKSVSCPSILVAPAPLASFTMNTPTPLTACITQVYEIRAFDAYGNLKTDYGNNLNFTAANSPVSFSATPNFINGIAYVNANLSLSGSDTVTATSIPAGVSISQGVNLAPSPVSALTFSAFANPMACSDFAISVQARDSCGNINTNYNRAYSLSVISGGVPINSTGGNFSSGISTISNFQVLNSGAGIQLRASSTAADNITVYTGNSATFSATANTNQLLVFDTIPGTITSCQNFSTTVRAKDGCGNTITSGALATATVNLSESSGSTFTPASVALVGGVGTFSAQIEEVGSARTILGDAGGGVTGASNSFNTAVTTTPTQISITNIPAAQMSCSPFSVLARAEDACGNTVTGFNGAATWSASAGTISPANPGSFASGILNISTQISPVNAGVTVSVNTSTPSLTGTSNSFNVNANTNPYTFNLSASPDYLLQDGSETIQVTASNIKDACSTLVPDGTNATVSFPDTANLTSVGGATQTTSSAQSVFNIRGLNTGDIGIRTVRVTIGGQSLDALVKLQNEMNFSPIAANSYRYASTSTPLLADLQSGTNYTAGEITQVATKDTSRLVDIRSPASGWTNLGIDMVGGFGSNRISNTGNGLAGFNWVYATNIGKFVGFGGQDFGGKYRSNTYFFDPISKIWTEASEAQFCGATLFDLFTGYSSCTTTAPSGRRNHMMAYMPNTGKVLLYGGYNTASGVAETWEFSPTTKTWTQIMGTQPQKRHSSVMVATASGDVYLFGGVDGTTFYNDVWRYNSTAQTWSTAPVGGARPAARRGAVGGMTADGRFYIFGGKDSFNYYNDTWLFSTGGASWTQVAATGCTTNCTNSPPGRANGAGTLVGNRNELFIFGGQNSSNLATNDTWFLNVTTPNSEYWTDGSIGSRPASTSAAGALALQTGTVTMYMAGGQTGSGSNRTDLWSLNGAARIWSQQHASLTTGCGVSASDSEKCSSAPFPRTDPGLSPLTSVFAGPSKLIVVGGEGSNAKRDDAWAFDPAVTTGWSKISSIIPVSGVSGSLRPNQTAYLTSTKKLLRFGGTWDTGCFGNDTWEYNPATTTWAQTVGASGCGCSPSCAASPPQPADHGYALAYDSTADRAVLAGVDGNTWEYNPGAQTWTSYTSDIGLRTKIKATSIGSGKILVYGGILGGTLRDETWEYDTATHSWTQYFPGTNPGIRAAYGLAYSPITNRAYLFGGVDNGSTQYNDLWEYNPTAHTWANLSGACTNDCSGPVFRSNTEMIFSPQDACLHVFGGEATSSGTSVYLMDRWRYCFSGNTVGTTLYHLHGFNVAGAAGVLATADSFELLFTGAGGGDTGNQGIFQVNAQVYIPGSGTFTSLGNATVTDEIDNTFQIPGTVSNVINGSNLVQIQISPLYGVGGQNGSGLMINQSRLRLRYH